MDVNYRLYVISCGVEVTIISTTDISKAKEIYNGVMFCRLDVNGIRLPLVESDKLMRIPNSEMRVNRPDRRKRKSGGKEK